MPATSEKQRRLAGADLERKRKGQKTRTGMTEKQLRDFARNPVKARGSGGKKRGK